MSGQIAIGDEIIRLMVVMEPGLHPANGATWEKSQDAIRRHLKVPHVALAEFCVPIRGQLGRMPDKPTPIQMWQAMQAEQTAERAGAMETEFLKRANVAEKEGKPLHDVRVKLEGEAKAASLMYATLAKGGKSSGPASAGPGVLRLSDPGVIVRFSWPMNPDTPEDEEWGEKRLHYWDIMEKTLEHHRWLFSSVIKGDVYTLLLKVAEFLYGNKTVQMMRVLKGFATLKVDATSVREFVLKVGTLRGAVFRNEDPDLVIGKGLIKETILSAAETSPDGAFRVETAAARDKDDLDAFMRAMGDRARLEASASAVDGDSSTNPIALMARAKYQPQGECFNFSTHGSCKWGNRCKYTHVPKTTGAAAGASKTGPVASKTVTAMAGMCVKCKKTAHLGLCGANAVCVHCGNVAHVGACSDVNEQEGGTVHAQWADLDLNGLAEEGDFGMHDPHDFSEFGDLL
jgi:hypothetical protein